MVVYFDNSASSHPKPEEVYLAQDKYFRLGGNPGRASHALAIEAARTIFEARLKLASYLGASNFERLVFTSGCTESVNVALKGLKWHKGDVVVVLPLAHNAVMRPLHQLEQQFDLQVVKIPYAVDSVVAPNTLSRALRELKPQLCIATQASNVTGQLIDLPRIAEICHQWKVPLMVDAAQSAGWLETGIDDLDIDLWCASGHKGLMGPPGVGILYVKPGIELEPLISGGTGSNSESFEMPGYYPDRLESGTQSGPAIAGLKAGVEWLERLGLKKLREHELRLTEQFLQWSYGKDWIRIYGPNDPNKRIAVVSFLLLGVPSGQVADRLDRDFKIAVRSGLHCAYEAHRALGTLETGLVRVSFGYFNNADEVNLLCNALEHLAIGRAK